MQVRLDARERLVRDLHLHGCASLVGEAPLGFRQTPAAPRAADRPEERRQMSQTVILGTARTPFAKMGGALASKSAVELGGTAIAAALERSEVAPDQVQQVIYGQVLQAGQGQIPSRQAQIEAGIPREVPSETINKVCASGMRAIGLADQAIRAEDLELAVTGGMESMSGAPYLLPGARFGFRMGDVTGDRLDDARRAHQPVHRQADDRRGERGRRRAGADEGRHGSLGRALASARRQGDRRGTVGGGDRRRDGQVAQGGEARSSSTRRSGRRQPSRCWRS